MATENYTEEMEAHIREVAASNGGFLNAETCGDIAETFGEAVRGRRSVIAKVVRMAAEEGSTFSYQRKQPLSKTGDPVENKSDIVSEIAERVQVEAESISGLVKAGKRELRMLRDALPQAANS